jgi:predicted amidophosphoribosyltransferase
LEENPIFSFKTLSDEYKRPYGHQLRNQNRRTQEGRTTQERSRRKTKEIRVRGKATRKNEIRLIIEEKKSRRRKS